MITTLFSWIVIFYTLFSLGDCFIFLYNKLCKNKEEYNLIDTFLLGICFACLLLPLSSFWLPSNHIILFAYIIIGTAHWIFNYARLKRHIDSIRLFVTSTTILQKIFILVPILSVLLYVYVSEYFYDAEYYQYQHIRWNEEYAIVPGLGNLEDRFGFNSNYLLLSAIFTFRFLFGPTEAIYSLQSLLYICILCWITVSLIKNGYSLFYGILLAISFFIIFTMGYTLASSSTDILPLLIIFYYLSKSIINTQWSKNQPLLALLLPITIVTFKLSTATFCLICLIPFIFLLKEKKYRELSFIISASFLIISLWCARNIITSGYLVYPLYSLDFFNFDWKVPKGTAILQEAHIYNYAKRVYSVDFLKIQLFFKGIINQATTTGLLNIIFYIIFLIAPAIIIYKYKKKRLDIDRVFLYIIISFCIIFNFLTAPDMRFNYGYILGLLTLLAFIFLNGKRFSKLTITTSILVLCSFVCTATYQFIDEGGKIGVKFENYMDFVALYHHRNRKNTNSFDEYHMGNQTIHIIKERHDNRTFDLLPAVDPNGIPFEGFSGLKIQDIRTIELRGESLQDGFKTKPEYIEIINNNIDKYVSMYYEMLAKRENWN